MLTGGSICFEGPVAFPVIRSSFPQAPGMSCQGPVVMFFGGTRSKGEVFEGSICGI